MSDNTGGSVPDHIIEGCSLLPLLFGETVDWRDYVISEHDYSVTRQALTLGLEPRDCRLFMVFDVRSKLMHAEGSFRPMLSDLATDPEEFHDLAKDDAHQSNIERLYGHLADWGRRMSQRVTTSDDDIKAMRGTSARLGVLPFLVDGSEVPDELTEKYRGFAPANYLET